MNRRGAIEDLSKAKKVSDGLRICQEFIEQTKNIEIFLDGSKKLLRMCRAGTQKSRWIEKLSRCYREGREYRKNPRWIENQSRIYRDLKKKARQKGICRGCVQKLSSLKKEGFSRREKHKEMNATNKLLKQTSKPHSKLSNSS